MKEDLNRIELIGRIGAAHVNETALTATYSLATNLFYRDSFGGAVVETTWHCVTYRFKAGETPAFGKGDRVHVIGRMHNLKYTAHDGSERVSAEVMAREMTIAND